MTLAYQIGDKVVHPAYGAGVVMRVVRKNIAGEPRRYYLIDPLAYDMEIMVAVDKVQLIGLRDAMKRSEVASILSTLREMPNPLPIDNDERQEILDAKLRSGDTNQVAEVVRDLNEFERQKEGRLGAKDARLLKRARESLAGELAVVEEISFEEALTQIDKALAPVDETMEEENRESPA